jgi:hypothetical protein
MSIFQHAGTFVRQRTWLCTEEVYSREQAVFHRSFRLGHGPFLTDVTGSSQKSHALHIVRIFP